MINELNKLQIIIKNYSYQTNNKDLIKILDKQYKRISKIVNENSVSTMFQLKTEIYSQIIVNNDDYIAQSLISKYLMLKDKINNNKNYLKLIKISIDELKKVNSS